jgi:predicted transcriptional regulator
LIVERRYINEWRNDLGNFDLERLCDVMFELSNEDRLRILRELEGEATIVTGLSNRLGLTNQEVSRHLSRLGDVELTTKAPDGQYSLTSYGRLTLKQIEGLEFTSRHKEYFVDHTAEDLPAGFVYRMGELEGSARVDDVMVVFHNIERMIREAEEYIWRLTDRYLMMALPELDAPICGGLEFRLMQSKDFEFPPDWPGPGRIMAKARVEGVFKLRESETANVFIAMSEKEVAALAFPTTERRFDYFGFASKDEGTHGWCSDVFQHYWDRARIPDFMRE